jgi:hypothetical protein
MMQSAGERHEVLKEAAAVRSSGALKKQHRGRDLAAERRQKPKDKSRRKLIPARRGTTTVQKWYSARDTGFRDRARKRLHQKPRRKGLSLRENGHTRKAAKE